MRLLMTRYGLVDRNEEGLKTALNTLESFFAQPETPDDISIAELVLSQRVQHQLTLARSVLSAQMLRRESRGSHFRSDFPTQNPFLESPILVIARDGSIEATFEFKRG